jgi:hypothetical protein
MRATIVVSVEAPEEVAAADAWFARWRAQLTYLSENTGCGCCVDIWDVDAPDEAVEELPYALNAMSSWTDPEVAAMNDAARSAQPRRPIRRKWKNKP